MEENKKIAKTVCAVGVIVAFCAGIAGGYFYGFSAGQTEGIAQGRQAVIEEQAQAAAVAEKEKREQIQNAANPFRNSYQNPFAE